MLFIEPQSPILDNRSAGWGVKVHKEDVATLDTCLELEPCREIGMNNTGSVSGQGGAQAITDITKCTSARLIDDAEFSARFKARYAGDLWECGCVSALWRRSRCLDHDASVNLPQ